MLFAHGAQLILPRSKTTMSAAMPGFKLPALFDAEELRRRCR
jgi:hypothetical protein